MSFTSRALAFASQRFPRLSSRVLASSGYTFDLDSVGGGQFATWTKATAERQDRAWRPLVAEAIAGRPRSDIAALFSALDDLPAELSNILEVGCGGGYIADLIAHHSPQLVYAGIDISPAMVELARHNSPARDFQVGDALQLPFADQALDVVMDGVALLHIPDWKAALAEYARVARSHVILHGLTLSEGQSVTFAKYAYGQPSRELVFNRAEILATCEAMGLRRIASHPADDYDLEPFLGIKTTSETWVFEV